MKVLFLSSWFPNRTNPLNGDFVERHALAMADFCETSVIHVVTDETVNGKIFEITQKKNQNLYEIIVYFKRNKCGIRLFARLFNLLRYGKGYLIGYRLLKKKFGKPDIIHANIIFPISIVAWLGNIFTGIPYIITEHWTLYLSEDLKRIPSLRITRKAVKKAFAVTPVTKNLADSLSRLGYENKYSAVPNVVDTDVFKQALLPVSTKKMKLLHVSSMKEEQKNIMGIIRAVKQLSEIRHDFMITFIGNAQAHQIALARELEIPAESITFKGEISHVEVADYMKSSHFLVMFSRVENLPCVILEALSCGLPVLSSDVGGIREWIHENSGLLVKSGDVDELKRGMIFMMDNYANFDRACLHKYAVDNFSRETIARRFIEIYKDALNLKDNV